MLEIDQCACRRPADESQTTVTRTRRKPLRDAFNNHSDLLCAALALEACRATRLAPLQNMATGRRIHRVATAIIAGAFLTRALQPPRAPRAIANVRLSAAPGGDDAAAVPRGYIPRRRATTTTTREAGKARDGPRPRISSRRSGNTSARHGAGIVSTRPGVHVRGGRKAAARDRRCGGRGCGVDAGRAGGAARAEGARRSVRRRPRPEISSEKPATFPRRRRGRQRIARGYVGRRGTRTGRPAHRQTRLVRRAHGVLLRAAYEARRGRAQGVRRRGALRRDFGGAGRRVRRANCCCWRRGRPVERRGRRSAARYRTASIFVPKSPRGRWFH